MQLLYSYCSFYLLYKLYRVHKHAGIVRCAVDVACYLKLSQFINYGQVDDLHVLQETIMGMLLIPGLH